MIRSERKIVEIWSPRGEWIDRTRIAFLAVLFTIVLPSLAFCSEVFGKVADEGVLHVRGGMSAGIFGTDFAVIHDVSEEPQPILQIGDRVHFKVEMLMQASDSVACRAFDLEAEVGKVGSPLALEWAMFDWPEVVNWSSKFAAAAEVLDSRFANCKSDSGQSQFRLSIVAIDSSGRNSLGGESKTLNKALAARKAGRYSESAKGLGSLVKRHPDRVVYRCLLAESLANAGRCDDSEAQLISLSDRGLLASGSITRTLRPCREKESAKSH